MHDANTDPAHCRRRKIRCLLVEGNSQQRCENCIRQKKNCVFSPVDEQNVIESPSQSSTNVGAGSSPPSTKPPSHLELGLGMPFERAHVLGSFPSLPSHVPPGFSGSPLGPEGALPGQGDPMPGFLARGISDFETGAMPPSGFQQAPVDYRPPWKQSDGFRSSSQSSMDRLQPPSCWRSSPTVNSGDFAPFLSAGFAMPPPGHHNVSISYPPPTPHAWHQSQEARSISYGNIKDAGESGHIPSNVGYQPPPAQEVKPAGAATYPLLDVNCATAQGAVGSPHSASLGTPLIPFPQRHPFAFQSQTQVAVSAPPLPRQQQS